MLVIPPFPRGAEFARWLLERAQESYDSCCYECDVANAKSGASFLDKEWQDVPSEVLEQLEWAESLFNHVECEFNAYEAAGFAIEEALR